MNTSSGAERWDNVRARPNFQGYEVALIVRVHGQLDIIDIVCGSEAYACSSKKGQTTNEVHRVMLVLDWIRCWVKVGTGSEDALELCRMWRNNREVPS